MIVPLTVIISNYHVWAREGRVRRRPAQAPAAARAPAGGPRALRAPPGDESDSNKPITHNTINNQNDILL